MQTAAGSEAIRQVATADLPTPWGRFRILGFERDFHEGGWPRRETAVALIMGDLRSKPPLARIHSQCLTGEVFGSLRCDCGQQLQLALSKIAEEGAGILIYEEQEGRGIGLIPKLQAYELQDLGCDTVEANERLGFKTDYREFILPVEILKQLGVGSLRLLSNNPDKVKALECGGIKVVERVPCEGTPSPHAARYLRAKKQKLRQLLTCL
jgi:GTP cyclohydrolase II